MLPSVEIFNKFVESMYIIGNKYHNKYIYRTDFK